MSTVLAGAPWEMSEAKYPVWDTRRLNDANIHFVTAFFDLVLRGEDGRRAYLAPAEADAPMPGFTEGTTAGIRLETMGF